MNLYSGLSKRRGSFSTPNAQRSTSNTSNRTASIETLSVERWRCWAQLRIPGVGITLTPSHQQMREVHWQRSRTGVSRAGDCVLAIANFPSECSMLSAREINEKIVFARHQN